MRDSCTPLLCDSYVLFHDPDRVQANLRERLFDRYVERYAAEWARAQATGTPVAESPANNAYTTASAPPATAAVPLSPKFDFPSAASIPPVSIMTAEPTGPPETKPAPAPAAPKRAQHVPPRAAARTAAPPQPPQPIGPPPSAPAASTAVNGPALH